MKRFWIMLLVVAVGVVLALPAGAKKPDNPGKPPAEPLVGMTCAESEAVGYGPYVDVVWSIDRTEFTIELRRGDNACADVNSVEGAWTIGVDMGGATEVGLSVRDSNAPGNLCWGPCDGTGSVTENGTYTFETPASELNACGTDFGDADDALAFIAWADFHGPVKDAATITVTLP